MSHVTVTISGRTYRMACAEGEERHLEGLAALLDTKIEDMRLTFGEIGEMRLHVMASIAIADDLVQARGRLEALESELADLRALASAGDERVRRLEARMALTVEKVAERLEGLARSVNPSPQPGT
jgi:cell division protein ZapA